MRKLNEAALQARAVVKLDAAVDELAAEARVRAVAAAAEVIKGRILDHLDKDASIRKMRRESIAKARSVLAVKRQEETKPKTKRKATNRKAQVKPQITTELPSTPMKETKTKSKKAGRAPVVSPEALHATSRQVADV